MKGVWSEATRPKGPRAQWRESQGAKPRLAIEGQKI